MQTGKTMKSVESVENNLLASLFTNVCRVDISKCLPQVFLSVNFFVQNLSTIQLVVQSL